MSRCKDQTGAALIMLIGVTVALALLSATLVLAVQNQQAATAHERVNTQSFHAAEAALDSAAQFAKVDKTMSTTDEWLTETELQAAFAGAFPDGADVSYRVYDNLATVDYDIKWDQGGPTAPTTPDHRVWVEAEVTYPAGSGKTTRTRCLVEQSQVPFAEALPKAVTYSDTGIRLNDTSDIYAVDPDTGLPVNDPSTSYQTNITAGGTWIPTKPAGITDADWAEVGRFTMNSSADLRAPGSSYQSLGIAVNGSVAVGGSSYGCPNTLDDQDLTLGGRTFHRVTIQPDTVGFLSDYFDQKAQSDLADESQAGATPAPTPSPWASTGFTEMSSTVRSTLENTSSTTAYTNTASLRRTGNLTINRNGTGARSITLGRLYVTGNLSISGPANFTCADLYVGGTLTIGNTRSTASTLNFGGPVYSVGAIAVSGNLETNGTTLYGGGNVTFTGLTTSTVKTHDFSLVYANSTGSTTTLSNNVQLRSSETTLNGNFTISGATTAVKNWLGQLYVQARPWASPATGTISWSGTASVTSRDYLQQADPDSEAAQPQPMWMGRKWTRTGDFDDEYGPTWVPGNSSLSVDFNSTAPSTIMCPLLCTTEQNIWQGNITYGTRDKPMVFFFMCDNNGIYPMVFEYRGTGTYYGLMVINESTIEVSNGISTKPSIQGAIFAGCPYDPTETDELSPSDIVLEDGSCVAYDQYVVGKIATSSLKTTTLVTGIVPGSWQQLPVNGD
jgi:hypothetical protein